MFVIKRDGRQEKVHFDKITSRIKKLCYGLNENFVDPVIVSQKVGLVVVCPLGAHGLVCPGACKVCLGVYKGVTTGELDELAAETAAHLTSKHPDYGLLAARIAVSNLHKGTSKDFVDTISRLHTYVEPKTGLEAPLIAKPVLDLGSCRVCVCVLLVRFDRLVCRWAELYRRSDCDRCTTLSWPTERRSTVRLSMTAIICTTTLASRRSRYSPGRTGCVCAFQSSFVCVVGKGMWPR